jgi:hypothetical protein
MTDMSAKAREHDLPPRWNGRIVLWGPWEMPPAAVFICGPVGRDRYCCPYCGSTAERPRACGLLAHKRSTTIEQIESYVKIKKGGMVAYRSLFAFRCTDCRRDQVWDRRESEWWDLDATDYGDDGSADPREAWRS